MENQAEKQSPRQKKKVITKIVCVVIAVLLMIGIAFIVANYVHKNNALPASSEVKNGLSAYELAAQQGYNGSLEEWLKTLDGKSAYEIAVDNGYTGTEDEWNKAIANISNQNNATIKNAEFSKDGDLMITLSDGTTINVGKIAGSDGKDGANGKNGTNGANGADGKDGKNGADGKDGVDGTDGKDGINGTNGVDGKDGQDGRGISSASVNENGQLILTFSDGSIVNLDKIVGTNGIDGEKGDKGEKGDTGEKGADGKNGLDGKDGLNGADGKDGVGISTIVVTDDGKLNITLSNGTTLNLGTIKGNDGKDGRDGIDGAKGDKGDKGDTGEKGADGQNGLNGKDGQDGIGISNVNINADGELVLTFSDNQTINLGKIVGKDGKDGTNGIDGVDGTDGTGIKNVTLSTDGELIITLSDNSVLNLGNVKGEKGDKGDKGDTGNKGDTGADGKDGKDGRGIAKTEINDNGELVITYTDGTSDNLGKIGSDETKEPEEDVIIFMTFFNTAEDRYNGIWLSNSNTEIINIPAIMDSEYGGYCPVVRIGDNDFESTKLKYVTIPKYCTMIDENVFLRCPNLNEAYFAVTSGWKNSETGEEISESTMANPYEAAALLRQGVGLSHSRVY